MAKQTRSVGSQRDLVLITGVSGSIGSALAATLAKDYHIVGLDLNCQEGIAGDCVAVDLTSDDAVEHAFQEFRKRYGERIAAVIHLAAYFDFSGEPNPLYEEVNIQGTRRLLRSLQSFHVERFVYAGTMLVHEPTQPGVPITEDTSLDAKCPS